MKDLVQTLDLKPHPEGGFYRETYRSAHSTAIYYLLGAGDVSHLHRIASDEVWHFHAGGALCIVELSAAAAPAKITRLGANLAAGEVLQHVVPAGVWFGAFPAPKTDFALVGCTVAPAFQFADFELALRSQLLSAYPLARQEIERLTAP